MFSTPQGSMGSGGQTFTPQGAQGSVYITPGDGPMPRRELDGGARQLEGVGMGDDSGIYAHQVWSRLHTKIIKRPRTPPLIFFSTSSAQLCVAPPIDIVLDNARKEFTVTVRLPGMLVYTATK